MRLLVALIFALTLLVAMGAGGGSSRVGLPEPQGMCLVDDVRPGSQ